MTTKQRKSFYGTRSKTMYLRYATPAKKSVMVNIGKYWSEAEESKLLNRFKRGVPVDHMCRFHRRDVGGIIHRLKTMGLLQLQGRTLMNTLNHSPFATFKDVELWKQQVNNWIDRKYKAIE